LLLGSLLLTLECLQKDIPIEKNRKQRKRMKPTAFITAQYKSATMMDFKVKEGAENMLKPSTVGSFTLTKSPIRKKSKICYR